MEFELVCCLYRLPPGSLFYLQIIQLSISIVLVYGGNIWDKEMDKTEDKVESYDWHASNYCINLRMVVFAFSSSLFDYGTTKSHCNIAFVNRSGNPVSWTGTH